MSFRRPIALLLLLPVLLVAAACGGSGKSAPEVPADAVALVDGQSILKADFDHLLAIGVASYKQKKQDPPKVGTADYEKLKQQALQVLFQRVVIRNEAKAQKIVVDEAAVTKQIEQLKTQAGDATKWAQQLKDASATEADYKQAFEVQQLAQKLYEVVTKQQATVTDAEIQAQYAKDKETVYKKQASRKVEHILLGAKDGSTPKPADYAKYLVQAKAVLAQLNAGADFKKLVDKYSTDPGKTQNHGEYDVTMEGYDPAFAKASFALKTGKLTQEPVKSAFGYHIIKALAAETASGYKTLDEVKDQIKSQLQQTKQQTAATDWFKKAEKTYEAKTTFAKGYGLPPEAPAGSTAGTTTG
jgi:peptidyl-prolyl cis-trans isomerase C